MSDVIDISKMFVDYKKSELQEYSKQQYVALQAALKKIKDLEAEVAHLQELLIATTPLVEKIIVSPEEALIENQIKLLEEQFRGKNQNLTLEETKILDLLLKNKKLLQEQDKTIQGKSKPVPKVSSFDDLLKIAATPDEK